MPILFHEKTDKMKKYSKASSLSKDSQDPGGNTPKAPTKFDWGNVGTVVCILMLPLFFGGGGGGVQCDLPGLFAEKH